MTPAAVAEVPWAQLGSFVAETMGLHFPSDRWPDLQRGLAGAAEEFGFDDVAACAHWLLSTPPTREQLHVLATHLTIGETYFFREKKTFEALSGNVLPALIAARRGTERRLRLWSAGCCSGEEAYSLAILLREVLPDWADWNIRILATDINPRFLKKAVAGVYGEWSFRDAPAGFKDRYFTRAGDGRYAVLPEIKKMVSFAYLNLAEDGYPSLATDTNAMDLIFCRNVLMYFTPAQIARVIANLHHALADGGWLAVSPSEASQALFARFLTRNFPGTILYQKDNARIAERRTPPPVLVADETAWRAWEHAASSPVDAGEAARERVRPVELPAAERVRRPEPQDWSRRARALADEGRLADALVCCDRWLADDKLAAAGHYLRAVILLEQGAAEAARHSLQRAIYLEPNFILAHYALGNLARADDRAEETSRHFTNVLHLLARLQPDDPLPESDGLTAGRLMETIAALSAMESTR